MTCKKISKKGLFFIVLLIFVALSINANYFYRSIALSKDITGKNTLQYNLYSIKQLYSYELPKILHTALAEKSREVALSSFNQFSALSELRWNEYKEFDDYNELILIESINQYVNKINNRINIIKEEVAIGNFSGVEHYIDKEMYSDIKNIQRPLDRILDKYQESLNEYNDTFKTHTYYIYFSIVLMAFLTVILWKKFLNILYFIKVKDRSCSHNVKDGAGEIMDIIDIGCDKIKEFIENFAAIEEAITLLDNKENSCSGDGDSLKIGMYFKDINLKLNSVRLHIKTLDRITEQVELISYNNAIEAERVGEKGEKFASMGREIRNHMKDLMKLRDEFSVALESAEGAILNGREHFETIITDMITDFHEVLVKVNMVKSHLNNLSEKGKEMRDCYDKLCEAKNSV